MKEIDEVDLMTDELIDSLKSSSEYIQYVSNLAQIKNNPEIYNRIKEFRKRSMEISLRDDIDYIRENDRLRDDFADMLSNPIANEFLTAERRYVRKVRKIKNKIYGNSGIELSFID